MLQRLGAVLTLARDGKLEEPLKKWLEALTRVPHPASACHMPCAQHGFAGLGVWHLTICLAAPAVYPEWQTCRDRTQHTPTTILQLRRLRKRCCCHVTVLVVASIASRQTPDRGRSK